MKKQGQTTITSVSLPNELLEKIEKALYKHRRKMCQQNTSRSKFISILLDQALESTKG